MKIDSKWFSVLVLGIAFMCGSAVWAVGPRYVWTGSASDGPGTSWSTAFHTIQQGIDAASSGDSVLVTNGIYYITDTITVSSGVTVQGVSGRDETIVDGQYPAYTNRCFYLNAGCVVDGFTVRNGYADSDVGGGVYMDMGAGKVANCTIVSNTAYSSGGGIYCRLGTLITNCVIKNNKTTYSISGTTTVGGGGVYMYNGGSLVNSIIENNTSGYYGGGVAAFGANTLVDSCMLRGNIATTGGGLRLYCDSYAGLVQNSTITNNNAQSGGGISFYGLNVRGGVVSNTIVCFNTANRGGGVIYDNHGGTGIGLTISDNVCSNQGGGVLITGDGQLLDSVISRNYNYDETYGAHEARGGGGLYFYNGGVVSNCTISGNMVTRKAAGVFIRFRGTLVNCVITNNQSVSGYVGGVYMQQNGLLRNCLVAHNDAPSGSAGGVRIENNSDNHLENCTITRNSCGSGDGGGINFKGGSVTNCIVYNNRASGSGDDVYSGVGYANFGYSCAPEISGGTQNITDAPSFINAGSGFGISATAGDYRLASGSRCIDNGVNLDWMVSEAVDLDGKDRISPRTNGVVDMGCYEKLIVSGTIIILM